MAVQLESFPQTGRLEIDDHAVVVTGYDSERHQSSVNDPYADEGQIAVSQGDLELAWSERDYH